MRERPSASLRRFAPMIGALCLTQALGGCFVDTEKPEVAIEVPDRYREASPARVPRPALDWWRGFRSRELTALMESAQNDNLDIAIAIGRIAQADAQARISNSALFPIIDLDGSATRSRASSIPGNNGVQVRAPDVTRYSTSLTASYTLDIWGRNRAALLAADQTAIATRFDRDFVALTTLASVGNAYFSVLGAQDRLRLARDNLQATTRILGLIRQRFDVGTASNLEIAQQEALVANVRASIPLFEITARQNMVTLGFLIGRAPENVTVRGGVLMAVAVPRVAPGLPSEILNQRPDIRESEAQLQSANHSVESARAAFFPTIALTGQAGFQSAALGALFGPGAFFYSAAASLAQPIFDGGLLIGQLEQQQGIQLAAIQTYRRSVINAFSDVERALIALKQNAERERLQVEAVRASRQAFDISEQRLREGTLDLVTLLNTQQTLFTAQDVLSQIRLARLLAVVALYQALGGGWSPQAPGDGPA